VSRIVVTTIGSLGDLHPQIAIALELQQRGHEIVFVTHQTYQAKIEALGLEFRQICPDIPATDKPEEMVKMMDLKTGSEYIIRKWVLPNLRDTYSDLMDAAFRADFIVSGELVYATPMVAEKLRIPWSTSSLQPAAFFSAYDPPVLPLFPFATQLPKLGRSFNQGVKQLLKVVTKSWAQPIHQLRRELQLSQIEGSPLIDNKCSPYLVLALFSSKLAQAQPDWPKNTIVTGFTFFEGNKNPVELSPELQQFLKMGEPPIVFTLGSAAVSNPGNFYLASIEAIQQLNLRAGCPTLIVPYGNDQPDNAARVERLGTSRTIPRSQYTAARVAKELRELLENPQYANKAVEIGQIIRSENGMKVACDAIEQQIIKAI
jgi:rhamnosyltransferase subunit B